MKRRTLITIIVLLSLSLSALPARAASGTRGISHGVGSSAQNATTFNSNLADIINTLPDGHHDNFAGIQSPSFCRAEGWAADPDDRSVHLNVRILSDGMEVTQTVADAFRQDLADAGVCTGGTCSFSVNLWSIISPDTDHVITVQAQDSQTGEWSNLYDTPKTLNCSEENILPDGSYDAVEGPQNQFSCVAEGWAIDLNDPSVDLNVRILSDNMEVTQTVASAFRQDLADAGVCPEGTCSFSVNLWSFISHDIDHSITIQAQDAQTSEWVNLNGSPKTLDCMGPSWQQMNADGFGDSQTSGVISLEVFQNQLYAGTANWGIGGVVWRRGQNGQWQQVSDIGFGSGSAIPAIIDLAVFQGQLYAGGGWNAPGQVWRSANGTNWQPVTTNGFRDGDNIAITNFATFQGMFYAGTGTASSSAQIWRSSSGNSNSWTKVAPDGPGLIGNVTGFSVYKNALYAAIEPAGGSGKSIQVWRSTNGSDWTTVTPDGFGNLSNNSTSGFAQFGGFLYLGIRNEVTGGQLWRTSDGLHWEIVISDGFGDISNIKIESLQVHNDLLDAVTFNPQTGLQIWRSVDGNNWEQIISNGFGNSNNFSTLWGNATLAYQGHLLIGTWNNVDGGELWMSTP